MKIYKILISLLCLSFVISSCYKKEDIEVTMGEIPYKVLKGDNEADQYIFNFYNDNGSIIRYDIDTIEYRWNFNKIFGNVTMTNIKINDIKSKTDYEIATLNKGIIFLEKVLLNTYDNEFKKKYFPLNIFMLDKIVKMEWGYPKTLNALAGLSYIAVGGIRDGVENLSDEELLSIRNDINSELWFTYLVGGKHIFIPEAFYSVSNEFYGRYLTGNVKENGFWKGNFVNKKTDLIDFINTIISTPYSVIKLDLEKYPRLKNKYDILTSKLKEKYNIDLQAIGNKNYKEI